MVDTRITGSYVYYVLYDKNAINKYEVHHFGRKMAIGAWLDKGRILSEFDRNEKNIIHLSKKHPKRFAVYFTFTTFALMGQHTP